MSKQPVGNVDLSRIRGQGHAGDAVDLAEMKFRQNRLEEEMEELAKARILIPGRKKAQMAAKQQEHSQLSWAIQNTKEGVAARGSMNVYETHLADLETRHKESLAQSKSQPGTASALPQPTRAKDREYDPADDD